jgi:carbonic anhydrase
LNFFLMSHACKNLLIRCMDFRLNKAIDEWVDKSGLFEGGYDVISLAGASKSLADGSEEIKNNFLSNVAVSAELHQAKKVIICHHSDCGAYAKNYKFNSPAEEKEKQIEDIKKSRDAILEKYPNIKIALVWADLKDSYGEKIEFEIIEK